jgi:hypothetical protein
MAGRRGPFLSRNLREMGKDGVSMIRLSRYPYAARFLCRVLLLDNLHRNTQKINFRCPESPKSPKFFVCIDNASKYSPGPIIYYIFGHYLKRVRQVGRRPAARPSNMMWASVTACLLGGGSSSQIEVVFTHI